MLIIFTWQIRVKFEDESFRIIVKWTFKSLKDTKLILCFGNNIIVLIGDTYKLKHGKTIGYVEVTSSY